MAVLSYFVKVAEDDRAARYRFGGTSEGMPRSLTIDKGRCPVARNLTVFGATQGAEPCCTSGRRSAHGHLE